GPAPRLAAVAGGPQIRLDGADQVLKNGLMPPPIADHRRRCAFVLLAIPAPDQIGMGVLQMSRHEFILLQNHGASRACELQPSGVPGVRRCRRLKDSESAVGELEKGDRKSTRLNS